MTDDLDIAPDFFSYFQATRHVMEKDKTIWCVSAWNDNGRKELVTSRGIAIIVHFLISVCRMKY